MKFEFFNFFWEGGKAREAFFEGLFGSFRGSFFLLSPLFLFLTRGGLAHLGLAFVSKSASIMSGLDVPGKEKGRKKRFNTVRKSFRLPRGSMTHMSKEENDAPAATVSEPVTATPVLESKLRKEVPAPTEPVKKSQSASSEATEEAPPVAQTTPEPPKKEPKRAKSERRTAARSPNQDKILWPLLERIFAGMQLGTSQKAELLRAVGAALHGPPRLVQTAECIQALEAEIANQRVVVKYTQLVVKAQAVTRRWLGVRRYKRLHAEFGGESSQMLERLTALRELTTSDRSFVKRFELVHGHLCPALADAASKKQLGSGISSDDVMRLFEDFRAILTAHGAIQKSLDSLLWPELTGVGQAMLEVCDHLVAYEPYVRHYKLQTSRLDLLCENEKFKAKLAELSKQIRVDLRNVFTSVISRVGEMAACFQKILLGTPKTNKDFDEVSQAARKILILGGVYKDLAKRHANAAQLEALAGRFQLDDGVGGAGVATESGSLRRIFTDDLHSQAHCSLLFEGAVTEVETVKDKESKVKVYAFVFSNAFIVAKTGKLFRPRSVVDFDAEESLSLDKSNETKGKDSHYLVTFKSSHGAEQHAHDSSHVFTFKDEAERDSWYSQLNGALEYHRKHDVFCNPLEELVVSEKGDGIPKVLLLVADWLRSKPELLKGSQLFAENVAQNMKPFLRRFFADISSSEFDLEKRQRSSGVPEGELLANDVVVESLYSTLDRIGPTEATAALKFFLHGIPEPLLGFGAAVRFAALSTNADPVTQASDLRKILNEFDEDNPGKRTAMFLLRLLAEVADKGEVDAARLATYLSPVFVRQEVSTIEFSRQLPKVNAVVRLLIHNLDLILGTSEITRRSLILPEDLDGDSDRTAQVSFRVSMYTFKGTKATHLSLQKGDVIRVTSTSATAWPRGVNKAGKVGKFPENFTQSSRVLVVARHAFRPSGTNHGMVIAKGDLIEVLEQNTDGWWKGTNLHTDQTAYFPGNYCAFDLRKVTEKDIEKRDVSAPTQGQDDGKSEHPDPLTPKRQPPSAPTKSVDRILVNGESPDSDKTKLPTDKAESSDKSIESPGGQAKTRTPLLSPSGKPYVMKAKFDFKPRSDREMGFAKDDKITLLHAGKSGVEKGGWWTGVNDTQGTGPGRFPSNYCIFEDQ
jgi:RhoGEF domain/SH3 domain/RhoGAP domain/Variant SH3 domain